MPNRFVLHLDTEGSYSILDNSTGRTASFGGRELTRVPADMAARGLRILNEMDRAERALLEPLAQESCLVH